MKKKILALCLVVVLVATAITGVTLAYFTDESEVATNTFTVGDIQIKLDEAPVDEDGKAIEDVERVTKNEYHMYPGMTYDKDPMVTVLADSEESYIRMFLTINNQAALDAVFADKGGIKLDTILTGYDASKWELEGYVHEGDTRTYEFRYFETVSTVDAGDKELEPLFTNIVIPGDLDNDDMKAFNNLQIDIVAQAIQAEGLDDADTAWAKWVD